MKKTITQRFFLSLCLMIVGCLWGSSAWAETITLSQSTIGSLLGSGGYMDTDFSYSGITWGRKSVYKNSGGIQIEKGTTKALWNKTAIPGAITQIVVKQNTNSSTLTVGSTAKPTTNRNSTAGNSTATYTFKASDKYQYFQIAATSSNYSVVTSIEITYEPLATINVSADALTFGNVETGYNATKNFTLSGYNLTANSTASLTLDDNSNFSVSPTMVDINAEGKITNKEITVTYAPTTTGEHSATLTIKSGETSKTVSLTGTGVTPKTHYTVTWMVNGAPYTEGTPSTDVAEGEKVATLPANPEAIGSKVFIGWTTSAFSGTSASAPANLFTTAEDAPSVTDNTTYYAVFAKVLSSTSSWNRVKTLAKITDGSYVIKNDAYILPSTTTTSKPSAVTAPTITGDKITGAVEESMIWQFTSTGTANQFYVRNAEGSYLYANSANEGIRISSTVDKWTFAVNTDTYFSMQESTNSRYCGVYNKQDWRSYTSPTASNYANGGKLELYKLSSENTYTAYATTVAEQDADLAFEQASYTVEVDNIITVKATNASGATITYSVDDETNCLVDENKGEFVAYAAGTYTITATCPATETHIAGTATCQVIVTLPASNIHATTYYKKITSTDELVDGGQYVIVYAKGQKGLLAGASNVHNETPATVVFEGNGTITTANAAAMTEITFEKNTATTYYLNVSDNKYINSSDGTELYVNSNKGEYALWKIDFDASGNVEITSKRYSTRGIMYSTSSKAFKNYAVSNRGNSGYPAIQLYQKVGEMPIAKATGYVSTYVADFAYVMPQHLTGHTVKLAEKQGVISTEKVFSAGEEVPALTPLLIKSDEDYDAEETSRNYNPAVLNKTVEAYDGENMLEYRRTAANLTNTMKDGSVYYYKLAIKSGNVGFYWGAENGAAFTMTKPSTAYLTVPQSISVQGFVLNLEEGETTGIATVVTNEDAPIYNLQGIRMNGKNLPKGIYIQGGKKFMVK